MNYYQILGLTNTATQEDITKAYRRLARQWHPDKNPDNQAEAEEKFKKLGEIYATLSDADDRKTYDEKLQKEARESNENSGNTENEWGESTINLDFAKQIFDSLLSYIQKYFKEGEEVVYFASEGDWDAVKILVDSGVSSNAVYNGLRAIHHAIRQGNLGACKYLVEKNAWWVNHSFASDKYDSNSPIHFAVLVKDIDIVKYLICKNADLSKKNIRGDTALHIAISEDNTDIAKYIIDHFQDRGVFKQDYNIANNSNHTPLDLALTKKNYEIADLLLRKGANLFGTTWTQHLSEQDLPHTTKYLLEKKQNLRTR